MWSSQEPSGRGGDAEVRAQDVFAEELVELHADGVLEEGDAAHVAGGVPGVGSFDRCTS